MRNKNRVQFGICRAWKKDVLHIDKWRETCYDRKTERTLFLLYSKNPLGDAHYAQYENGCLRQPRFGARVRKRTLGSI